MVNPQQRAGFPQMNSHTMDINRNNKNCYACGGFGHLVRNCKNRGMGTNRKIEVEQNNNNLKEKWNLIVFD